ncbi:hypothetical protein KHA80_06515 [Anaerobacillus sp. HL2]|nr:hypothetical protein KHA80_06515 [Anaerobacillus sp. HL2]
MLWGNLMLLVSKYDWSSEVKENSMIAGDIIRMNELWKTSNLIKSVVGQSLLRIYMQ